MQLFSYILLTYHPNSNKIGRLKYTKRGVQIGANSTQNGACRLGQ